MSYVASFQPNQIISSSQFNTNFSILRDNLEVLEDVSPQIDGVTTDLIVSNTIAPATYSLVEVFRNGLIQTQAGLTPDYQIVAANVIRFTPPTNIPQIGESVCVKYRKVV